MKYLAKCLESAMLKILVAAAVFCRTGRCCDEFSWEEVQLQHQQCLKDVGFFSLTEGGDLARSRHFTKAQNHCMMLTRLEECSSVLHLCEDSHHLEISSVLSKHMPREVDHDLCDDVLTVQDVVGFSSLRAGRHRRTAKKGRGGGSRSSRGRGSTISRVASAVRQAGAKRGGGLGSLLGSRNRNSGLAAAAGAAAAGRRKKGKGKLFSKVGKYAVAGLAAYGTYKLAKKMSKGLRKEYDDDECWQYNYFSDEYQCTCDEQCNVYVGAAAARAASLALVFITAVFSVNSCRWL